MPLSTPISKTESLKNLQNPTVLLDFHVDYETLQQIVPLVDFVSFTGSTKVGKEIYASIAKNSLIDCTLELGGNDAAYICEENDSKSLEHAVETVVDGAFYNAGQSCCGIERCLVHEKHADNFIERIVDLVKANYQMGDPLENTTTLGPIAKKEHVKELEEFVADAVSKGAEIAVGGNAEGNFFQPTVLTKCNIDMRCMQEEMFGPVLAVANVSSDEEAVSIINDSSLGLTASIFTNDVKNAKNLLPELEVGTVFMNRADYLDPYLPWQGRKDTGKGCSLGVDGFRGFYNLKNEHFRF